MSEQIKRGSRDIEIAVYNGRQEELAYILLSNGYKVWFEDITNDHLYSWQDNHKGVLVCAKLKEEGNEHS